MPFCPKCGVEISEDDEYCPKCRYPLRRRPVRPVRRRNEKDEKDEKRDEEDEKAAIMGGLGLWGGGQIVRQAWRELHTARVRHITIAAE